MKDHIKAVLWDNDGVLVDTEPLYYEANRQVFEELGHELTVPAYRHQSLKLGKSVFALLDEVLDPQAEQPLRKKRNQIYSKLLETRLRVFPGAAETLEQLAGRKWPMAVVTSSLRDHFETIHRQTGLLRHFSFVLAGEDCPQHKPHPAPYLTAAERLGVDPRECLVVEDTERGLQAALAAEMRCVVIPHSLTQADTFEGAHARLDSIRQVPEHLPDLPR